MITLILLIIIYLAFISLGLPDSLLGVTWPAMRLEWGMSLDAAGLVAILTTGSTVLSSFASGHVVKRFGTGKTTFISCMITGIALLGISFSPSYFWLLLLAIPLGLGAGSVDTALNNYVALHFKSHHMSWLHCFWGVGATVGPIIMAQCMLLTDSWRFGYRTIGIIQLILALVLFMSLPLWVKHRKISASSIIEDKQITTEKPIEKNVFKLKGVKYALSTFFFYCAVEFSVGLWGSSFLIHVKNISVETAASWVAMYYGGITVGRFISGFVTFKMSNKQMIRRGQIIAMIGSILLLLPLPHYALMGSLVLIGLGLAPIFPCMIHETPTRFGKNNSQIIIGYQMAFAYIGGAFFPPLFGVLARTVSLTLFPYYLILCIMIMFISSETLTVHTKSI